jgi:pyruvate formate lyase activating enzyme
LLPLAQWESANSVPPADPLIVDIKRHSLEDGPGIRSVVFFKGCPLRCPFCHNPEAQAPEAEIAFSARHCVGCGECARVCPDGAIDLQSPGRINREACSRCGRCAEACPGGGLRRIGTHYSPADLAALLLRDLAFYRHSGGGVTLSGGECTMCPEYLEELLRLLKSASVAVAIQTSGLFDYAAFEKRVLPSLDLVYFDLKLADPEAHARLLGAPNEVILRNLRRLIASRRVAVHPRIPLVPGLTATTANLAALAEILRAAGAKQVSLLPYHAMGLEMYEQLGRPRPEAPDASLSPAEEDRLRALFAELIAAQHGAPAAA